MRAVVRPQGPSLCGLRSPLKAPSSWSAKTGSQSSLFPTCKAGGCTCLLPPCPVGLCPLPSRGPFCRVSLIKDSELPPDLVPICMQAAQSCPGAAGPLCSLQGRPLFVEKDPEWEMRSPGLGTLWAAGLGVWGSSSPQPLQGRCVSPGIWSKLNSRIRVTVGHTGSPPLSKHPLARPVGLPGDPLSWRWEVPSEPEPWAVGPRTGAGGWSGCYPVAFSCPGTVRAAWGLHCPSRETCRTDEASGPLTPQPWCAGACEGGRGWGVVAAQLCQLKSLGSSEKQPSLSRGHALQTPPRPLGYLERVPDAVPGG